jgi:hypothetical protein
MAIRRREVILAIVLSVAATSLLADERQECRQKRDVSKIADCIERGVYDPCDDAGGAWGRGMCGAAHIEVAERRIKKSTAAILKLFDAWKLPESPKFLSAQEDWRQYRDKHCSASGSLAQYFIEHSEETIFAMDISENFCILRLTEGYASELEFTLSKARQ